MSSLRIAAATWFVVICPCVVVQARVWTDSTGRYTLDAELVSVNDRTVVLQRADHEMVAIPIDKLSQQDREFLKSKEAAELVRKSNENVQTWTLRDGMKITGRIVEYAQRDITLQRRRGRIYVNDRLLDNLPEFYRQLIPKIVAHVENLQRDDRASLEAWLVRQRGQPRTIHLEGVVLEAENGDEYAIPFFMLSDEDLNVLKPRWSEWQAAANKNDYMGHENHTFLLRSLAAARHRDRLVNREIALMKLQLQAVQAGITSLWEVTLYPAAGQSGPPLWVVVPGRNSRQATATALERHPGYVAGPVRRVAG
ncbi:MAG: hypothetical protein L0228_12110 [Planctomycetes bacterium]|nr:hypothetical protein [Planctomycetota bacterium]